MEYDPDFDFQGHVILLFLSIFKGMKRDSFEHYGFWTI